MEKACLWLFVMRLYITHNRTTCPNAWQSCGLLIPQYPTCLCWSPWQLRRMKEVDVKLQEAVCWLGVYSVCGKSGNIVGSLNTMFDVFEWCYKVNFLPLWSFSYIYTHKLVSPFALSSEASCCSGQLIQSHFWVLLLFHCCLLVVVVVLIWLGLGVGVWFFETEFHVLQTDLTLAMWPRITLNFWFSCLYLPSIGIINIHSATSGFDMVCGVEIEPESCPC